MGQSGSSPTAEEEEPEPGVPQDRPLPEEPFDQDALSNFQCPFQVTSNRCWLLTSMTCPFGHQPRPPLEQIELQPVPWYVCLDRLLNCCESNQIERITPQLVRCENGLHVDPIDLIDREHFAQRLAFAVLSGKGSAALDTIRLPKCCKCKQTISTTKDEFCGFLENCSHRLCAKCVEAWRANWGQCEPREVNVFIFSKKGILEINFVLHLCLQLLEESQLMCPVCLIDSSRILLWPEPFCSQSYKTHLFAMQKACFNVFVKPQTGVSIHDVPGNGRFTVIYKGSLFLGELITYTPLHARVIGKTKTRAATTTTAGQNPLVRGKTTLPKTRETANQGTGPKTRQD